MQKTNRDTIWSSKRNVQVALWPRAGVAGLIRFVLERGGNREGQDFYSQQSVTFRSRSQNQVFALASSLNCLYR